MKTKLKPPKQIWFLFLVIKIIKIKVIISDKSIFNNDSFVDSEASKIKFKISDIFFKLSRFNTLTNNVSNKVNYLRFKINNYNCYIVYMVKEL